MDASYNGVVSFFDQSGNDAGRVIFWASGTIELQKYVNGSYSRIWVK